MPEPRDATRITAAANAAVRKALPFGDTQDFDDVNQGA
jgi:alkyl sulfatase BDS1-like metallo-beta-lactamase superfamily hydrolase